MQDTDWLSNLIQLKFRVSFHKQLHLKRIKGCRLIPSRLENESLQKSQATQTGNWKAGPNKPKRQEKERVLHQNRKGFKSWWRNCPSFFPPWAACSIHVGGLLHTHAQGEGPAAFYSPASLRRMCRVFKVPRFLIHAAGEAGPRGAAQK